MPSTAERTSGASRPLAESTAELLRLIPAPLLVVDREGVVALANAAVCELLATGREALVGRRLAELAEDGPAEIARMLALFASSDGWLAGSLRLRRADGVPVPFPCKGTLVQRPLDGRAALIGIELDHHTQFRLLGQKLDELDIEIRRRRDAEERLRVTTAAVRRLLAYNRSLIEASLDPLVTISPEGKITDVNRATEEVTGVPRARLIGTDFADYFTEPEQARAAYRRVLEVGELRDCALTIRHAGGGTTEVLYNASRYCPSGNPEGVFAAARDVTERKRAEAERLRITEQLLQSQKLEAVGRLAGGVAHDVNNVLTVILAATEYLLGQGWSPEARERVEEINEAAARAAALARQLLIFTRRGGVESKVLELNAVVASTDRMLRRLIGENVEMVTELDPAAGRVRADPSHLEQVITNLVVNARDAMPEGGRITIRTSNVEVPGREGDSDLRPGRYVVLSVRDTGRGMSGDVLSHIFEPFFTTKPVGEGTGLGLSTVYAIVRRAGGGIRVASVPGAGTTFDVYLPREPAVPEPAEPQGPSAATGGSESILLVEDEPVLREREAEALQALGYEVVTACDGEEASRLVEARAGPFDLVVTDVVMPRLGGRELVARLRSGRPELKVLFISGYSQPARGPVPRAAEAPLLQKPFTPDQLARTVRELLDER